MCIILEEKVMFNHNTDPFYRLKAALIITLAFLAWEKLHPLQPASELFTPLQPVSKIAYTNSSLFCHNEPTANFRGFPDCVAKPTFDLLKKNATIPPDGDKTLTSSSLD